MEGIDAYIDGLTEPNRSICGKLRKIIDRTIVGAASRLYHGAPVWFIAGNPILGLSIKQGKVALLFWSGQSFAAGGLAAVGKHKAAEAILADDADIDEGAIKGWIEESLAIQWNYKDIAKNKGVLARL